MVCRPCRRSSLGGALADAPQRVDRQRVKEVKAPAAGTTSRPSGLARVEASLAMNFVVATPTEHGNAESLAHPAPDQLGDRRRAAEQPPGPGHVQERLVDARAAPPAA